MKQFVLIGLLLFSYVAAEEFSLATIETGKVVLSWEELKILLEEIETLKQDLKQLQEEPTEVKPPLPVEYSIIKSNFLGEVKGMSAQFKADFSMQILKDGWVKIPFFNDEVGIESINIQEEIPNTHSSAQFIRNNTGYYLFAKGPQAFSMQILFRVPIKVTGLTYNLNFLPPRSVINHIKLQIPAKGLNFVHKTGNIISEEDGITIIDSFLSKNDSLQLSWKVEKDNSITRKSRATLHSLASIDKSDISIFSTVTLKHITTLENINFRLPLDIEIIDVTSLNIEKWSIEKLKDAQVIKIIGKSDANIKIDISY
ncbi:MAG: hypothetical protein IMF12_09500, partial [Proteobacteria bacterium]|nr:hypothetical protein [Pseudomonadota bacterium]